MKNTQQLILNSKVINITKLFLSIFVMFLISTTSTSAQDSAYKKISSVEYKAQIKSADKNIQLIDVRTPGEFNQGHIEGAINIDFRSPDFANKIEKLDNSKTVYIYCRSGNRSGQSSRVFIQKGFKEIIDLQGGYARYHLAN